ncbi:restriction endonuclease subunit S [Lactococcus petauri]|uniref:restriction endonuclease subunit S n=1 Tax=Lactococcus petauri TaxID=1940789 RepID=UPI0022E790E7|nr:restriction endonuclease subunit S [Lactococcus petauri]
MMSKKSPQLRFEGFTDDWGERKLGDIGDTFTGLTGKTKEDFGHGSAKFVTYVNVFQNPIATLDQLEVVEIDEKQNQVQKGDVFFTTSSETPEEVGMSSVWTHDTKNVYLNSFTFGYRPRVSFDLNYMASMLRSPSIRKKITFLAQGISRYNISKTKMLEIEIPTPNLSEQQKIGAFFKKIDDTIALHQRKLDLLKEQKKGYLQKMFPKNGAKVPELRFEGFADDWEERKLSDIADRFDNLRVPITASDRKPGDTPYYGANGIQDYVEGFTHNGEFILVAEDGANDLKNYPVQYVNGKVWVNNHAHVLQGKKTITDNKFLMNAIKNFNIEPFLVGGGRAKLNADVMMKLNILLPTFVEQEKIGSLFSLLDKTIALHQRKLDLLKEQKKGFLQKMFV